jgi:hypothetical protein
MNGRIKMRTKGWRDRVHHLKRNKKQSRNTVRKSDQKQIYHPSATAPPNPPPRTPEARVRLWGGRDAGRMRKSCTGANMVDSLAERVFVFDTLLAALFANNLALRILTGKYRIRQKTVHRLVIFRNIRNVYNMKHVLAGIRLASYSYQTKAVKQLLLMSPKLINTAINGCTF